MNRTITAMGATLLSTAGAFAQTSVSLYGVADVYLNLAKSGQNRITQLKDGGLAASRIGFRGREDLGGGHYANFVIEGGYNADIGTGTLPGPGFAFTRNSSVGISGPWGQFDAGRMLIPAFYGMSRSDPFVVNGTFSQMNLLSQTDGQVGRGGAFAFRASNMLRYRSPQDKPFTLDLTYSPGEVAKPNERSGVNFGGNVAYAVHPFYVAYSFHKFRSGTPDAPVAAPVTASFDILSAAFQASSSLRIGGNYARIASSNSAIAGARVLNYGVLWKAGASTVAVAVSRRDVDGSPRAQRGMTLGYDHALSKRTSLYARYLVLRNKANASASIAGVAVTANSGDDIKSLGFGIKHSF